MGCQGRGALYRAAQAILGRHAPDGRPAGNLGWTGAGWLLCGGEEAGEWARAVGESSRRWQVGLGAGAGARGAEERSGPRAWAVLARRGKSRRGTRAAAGRVRGRPGATRDWAVGRGCAGGPGRGGLVGLGRLGLLSWAGGFGLLGWVLGSFPFLFPILLLSKSNSNKV